MEFSQVQEGGAMMLEVETHASVTLHIAAQTPDRCNLREGRFLFWLMVQGIPLSIMAVEVALSIVVGA